MRVSPLLSLVLCVGLAAAEPPVAIFSGFNDWLGADVKGVRIGADGHLSLAPALRRVAQVPEGVIWAAISDGSGGAFLSAGTEGKLFRYSGGQVRPLTQVKGGIVFAMARMGQDLIVAPSGEGKLLRISPNGEIKPFADIDARLVWGLQVQGSELVVAGGGERGALLLLAREGSSRKLAELPEETSFTSLLPDGQGGCYLGTHGRGLVARYSGVQNGDRLETLVATGFEEVRSLALQDGDLYIGATNGLANRLATGSLERREGYLTTPESGNARSAVIRFDRTRVPQALWTSAQSQVYALTVWGGQLLVGTGNRSRLFAIPLTEKARDLEPFSVLQDLGTAQATAFLNAGSDLMVVAANPGELHLLSEAQATEGSLESRVLKANPIADWGRAYVDAELPPGTSASFQYRVGATETPDSSWTPWTPPLQAGERPNLRSTRFAQFRLKLVSTRGGTTPSVTGVRVHWANRNLAPVWEGVEVMPPGVTITRNAPPDDIGIERIPLETQKLIPALGYAGGEKRAFRRGAQAFVFKVNDPNGDALNFRLRLLPEKGNPIELEQAWKDRFFTFDTLPVPDGRYRLEVVATDAPSQAFNQALSSSWRTAPFMVDHTPPAIIDLSAVKEGENLRVRFQVKDEHSIIREAMVSADGETWLQVAPEDRVFDLKEERFEVLIPREKLRGDRVSVRAIDFCSNEQTAAILVAEPTGKKR